MIATALSYRLQGSRCCPRFSAIDCQGQLDRRNARRYELLGFVQVHRQRIVDDLVAEAAYLMRSCGSRDLSSLRIQSDLRKDVLRTGRAEDEKIVQLMTR